MLVQAYIIQEKEYAKEGKACSRAESRYLSKDPGGILFSPRMNRTVSLPLFTWNFDVTLSLLVCRNRFVVSALHESHVHNSLWLSRE